MKWPVVLIGVVLIAGVAIFAVSYGAPKSSDISNSTSTIDASIIPGVESLLYADTQHGFTILYPQTASTTSSGFDGFLSVTKSPVFGVYLPQSLFKGTNLVEAGIFIGVSSDSESLNACMTGKDGEQALGTKQIGSNNFKVFASTGAAAGNLYDETIYRTVRNGDCYEIVQMLHSGNIGNYPAGTVKQYDRDAKRSILDSMLNTFAFTDKSGSGVQGKLRMSCTDVSDRSACDPAQTIEAYQGVSPVALFKSNTDGSFSAVLPPGQYELRVDTASTTRCASVGVVVTNDSFISTDISCEAGAQA